MQVEGIRKDDEGDVGVGETRKDHFIFVLLSRQISNLVDQLQ
jgi:hypothetical protein